MGQHLRLLLRLLVLLLAGVGTALAAAPWTPAEEDQLLLELRSGAYKLGEPLRGYQTPQGVCIDLADTIQALDLPVRLDKKSRRATGWLFAEDQRFALDREAGTVLTPAGSRALAAGAIHDTAEGWCVETAALAGWLGVELAPDLANLAVTIRSPRKLPFLEAIERRSRAERLRSVAPAFDLASLPRAALPYRDWRSPALDVQIQAETSRGGTEGHYELLAAGEALGMSYTARLSGTGLPAPDSLRLRAFRLAPEGGLLGPLAATQVALGDVETPRGGLTAQGGYGRGAFVSNRPIDLPTRFGTTALRGDLPAGWDAELYRNGELRAYQADRGDGRYAFEEIELVFGENDFDVVLHGPQGQVRHQRSSVPVGSAAVPAGQTWYWAGMAEDRRDLVSFTDRFVAPGSGWRWGVGVERGIDRRTSAGVEYQSLVLGGRRHDYLETVLRRSLGAMLVEGAVAQQFGGGRAWHVDALGRVGAMRFEARSLWVQGQFDSELVGARQVREHALRLNAPLDLAGWRLPVEAGLTERHTRDGARVREATLRASGHVRRLALSAEWLRRSVRGAGPAVTGELPGSELTVIGNTSLGRVRLRGSARFRLAGPGGRGFEQAQVLAEAPLDAVSSLRAGYERDLLAGRDDVTLGYVRQFERFALRADARADNRGGRSLALTLAFSLGRDPGGGGWRASRDRLAETGQAGIAVFRDDNGDGVRDPGEEPVPGVRIEAGFRHGARPTDAQGHAAITGLTPYVPVLVSIDAGSLPDPLLQPRGRGMVVVPRPGVAAQLELALAPTGEIEAVLLGPDGEPRGGAAVELTDPAGRPLLRALADFDGYVLFEAVPYGDYRLQLAGPSAAALGAQAELTGPLRIDRAHPSLQLGRLRARPTPAPAQVALTGQLKSP